MGYKVLFLLIGLIFVVFGSGSASTSFTNLKLTKAEPSSIAVEVVRVIDGDTIEIGFNGKKETVRLIGVDAPELSSSRKSVECLGKEASDFARSMLENKQVLLEPDFSQSDRDKYGRLLRYVILDKINFNRHMISEGFAHEYTYLNIPYKYQNMFRDAERQARIGKKGLWAKDNKCYN